MSDSNNLLMEIVKRALLIGAFVAGLLGLLVGFGIGRLM